MRKRIRKILPIMTMISCISFTSVNASALEGIPTYEGSNKYIESSEVTNFDNTDLRPLDYTIDEIREMTMEEYYTNIFPELWETFTIEEKEQCKNIKYSEVQEENDNSRIVDVFVGVATIASNSTRTVKGQVGVVGDGSKKANNIAVSYVLYDTTGATYAGGQGSRSNVSQYAMTYESRVLPSGRRAYVEGVVRVKVNSNSVTQSRTVRSNQVTVR
ncbi:MAG: hypothetical protein ACRC3Y_05440 [Romboutsia sp.]|uniref:hypothetical protein n=1 Tax=Romboutsia sp. TaxID=1965302 RepID=UPI003F373495